MKKRKGLNKKKSNEKIFFIKKLILIFGILLLVLLFIYVILNYLKIAQVQEEKALGGELGTLCIFCEDNPVRLTVLNYTIGTDNLTIHVNINWTSGNISSLDFGAIRVYFVNESGYNFTLGFLPPGINLGENKTYDFGFPPFSPVNFENVVEVHAYAEVDIHLTQTSPIPNITFYKNDSRDNLIHLNNYFRSLTEINYSLIESPQNDNISVIINNVTKNVSISILDGTWFGTQIFNLTVSTADGDSLTTNFSVIVLNENRPGQNRAPEFNEDNCSYLSWNRNMSYILNMVDCWTDDDNNSLIYGYRNKSNSNLTISQTENSLTITPNINWNGTERFYIWANDSIEKVTEEVYFVVRGPIINTTSNDSTLNVIAPAPFIIQNPVPNGNVWTIFQGSNQTFSVSNSDYETIEWYLDDQLKMQGVGSYNPGNLSTGNYTIRVVIRKGEATDSRTWSFIVRSDKDIESIPLFDFGQIIFYVIVLVLFIIILLLIWLFIEEKQRQNRQIKEMGFGFSVKPKPSSGASFKQSVETNIPR